MPPTRRSNRVAFSTAPGSQRNDRQQARAPRRRSRSTRGESSQTATIAEVITTVAPAVSLPTPTTRQAALPEDLITTLVSSVTTAVTQQLSALLPSPSAAPSTNSSSLSTMYPVVQSVSSDHAATLVQDALGDVHSTLSGQPRPFNLTEQLPTQPFHSASLPLDARVPEKIKEKIWKGEFVDFGVLLSNPDPTHVTSLTCGLLQRATLPLLFWNRPQSPNKYVILVIGFALFTYLFPSIHNDTHMRPPRSGSIVKLSKIWPHATTIGLIMTKTFDFCAKRKLLRSLGRPFIGNCGCARRIIRVEQVMCLHRKVLHNHLRLCPFRGAFAINFTAEPTAQAVNLSTFVLSVTVHIVP